MFFYKLIQRFKDYNPITLMTKTVLAVTSQ